MQTPGSVEQCLMAENPAILRGREIHFPLRGIVGAVRFKDHPKNMTGQTVVDISMLDGFPPAYNVPLSYDHIDQQNGRDETPLVGSLVLVQFIAGRIGMPVVTRYLASPNTAEGILALSSEAPCSKRTRNGTSETIAKDGSRTLHVAAGDIVDITGDGAVTIGGTLTITVNGNATITSTTGTLTLDATTTHCTGNLTASGTIGDGVRTIEADRVLFDAHVHTSASSGSPTSPPTTTE